MPLSVRSSKASRLSSGLVDDRDEGCDRCFGSAAAAVGAGAGDGAAGVILIRFPSDDGGGVALEEDAEGRGDDVPLSAVFACCGGVVCAD